MAFPIISWIPKIIKTAANILGVDSVKDVVDALENNKLTPDQRVALDAASKQFELEMRQIDVQQMQQFVTEAVAEINSGDKYTARARPTGLYMAYFLSGLIVVASVVFKVEIDRALIAEIILPMYSAAGYYMYLRSKEKMNGNGTE